jgi:hypothetical protein
MAMRKKSLAGSVLECWLSDGKPSLTWEKLVRRTMKADRELEKAGLNPAPAFRNYRINSNTAQMQRYVAGFYEYEFSPNYNPRKQTIASIPKTEKRNVQTAVVISAPEHESDADFVINLFKQIENILQDIEPPGPYQNTAAWINELERKSAIPRQISFRMHSIRLTRNRVVHDRSVLSETEKAGLNADWAIINEWWKIDGRKLITS